MSRSDRWHNPTNSEGKQFVAIYFYFLNATRKKVARTPRVLSRFIDISRSSIFRV